MDNKNNKTSDEELVELSAMGDKNATETLLNRYKNTVKVIANQYFLQGADHDDIVQEGMIGLFKAIRDFDITKRPSFKSFADLCIKRNILTAVKASSRKKHSPLNSYVSLNITAFDEDDNTTMEELIAKSNSNPEESVLRREKTELLNNQIEEKLSSFEKSVLILYLKNMSYTEIATKLNKPAKSIDNALQRIKHKLNDTGRI